VSAKKIEEEAARLFTELHQDDAQSQAFIEWQRWMNADPAHRMAYERIEQTMMRLKIPVKPPLPSAEEIAADEYDGSMSIEEWQRLPRSTRKGSLVRFATAACLAVLSLVAGGFWLNGHYRVQHGTFALHTSAGERREFKLPEGSRITLDADSVLNVELTPELRSLRLTRGEAYFKVSKDAVRPFIVRAGNALVRAVGTAFNVRMSADRTVVAVTDGKVEVTSDANPVIDTGKSTRQPAKTTVKRHSVQTFLAARVSAGEAVSYANDAGLQELPASDASLATTWLSGRRQYRDEPLRYVLADIDRYTGKHIEIAAGPTGDLKFTGTLDLDNAAAWIKGLSVALPVKVAESKEGRLLIEAR
jgi:transmembrane sensor